ncbi:hypothetical protein LX87_04521 [Larkinella arboricola]|uniref:Uncharacterized protein n=1 Tax=Larkinella arboricola TaxID=643671 RepID=A0A327WM44_LARAB|nr:hypothetical protein [Larkinella arboricola]RAJ93009.1 hypothetical protein LX87_04521 [Larkinella arboricola]
MANKSVSSSPTTLKLPKAGKSHSAQPEVSPPVKKAKSMRGRPPKLTFEKAAYAHVVLPEHVMQSLDLTHFEMESIPNAPVPAITAVDGSSSDNIQRTELAAKLNEIKIVPAAYAYYWQLVFSASFYRLRNKATQDNPSAESSDPGRSFSVRQVAQAAGLEYHNLKNLFTGRGTLRHLHDYQLFLYSQGIEFAQLQFNAQLIDKAYFYLICLRQPDISKEIVTQLFF